MEHFLQNLAQRKCNYNVVFFESHSQLCIPRGTSANNKPKYLLARSIVKRHLSANLQRTNLSIDIRSFKNVQDANFIEYLRATGVYFVMSHDGANPIPLSISASDDEAVKMEKDRIEAEETTRKVMLRSMIGALISHGYNVALINGLEWQDTKVMTLVVEKHDRARSQFHVEEPELEDSESENLDGSISSDKGDPNEQSVSELTLLDGELLEGLQPLNDILSSVPQTCKCASAQTAHSYQGLSERVYLTIATLGHILTLSPELRTVAADFLLHTALLRDIPIRHRRCPPVNQEAENYLETVNFLIKFSETSTSLLQKKTFSDLMNKHTASCDLADLVDGRLLYFIRAHVLPISTSLKTSFDEMAALVCIMSGVHLSMSDEETGKKSCTSRTSNAHHEETAILPFANPVFDKHLTSINIKVSTKKETVPQTARIFKEVSHWHNAKRRLDLKVIAPMSARDKVRASRRNDFFMAEMQSYAASLTNSTGKSLEPEIITLTGKAVVRPEYMKENDSSKEANSKQSGGAKAVQKGKGASKKQAMLDGIAASKAVKDNDNVSKVFSTWQTVRKNLDAERSRRAKYLKMKAYLRDLPDQKRKILNVEVEFHLLSILVEMYGDLRKGPESRTAAHAPEMFGIAALLWDTCRRLAANDDLTKTIADRLKFIIKALHLPTIGNPNPTRDRALACDPNLWLPKGSEASVGVDSQDFQLVHCGPYMDRNLDSAPDSRVPFEPDAWQRAVLDELDAERSVFVVAPTSAGKTFISFYAMEKILRANDESVLVYVAPTKALVNQIAAEIQARFRKTYKHAGKSVWAIHTRDYRINSPTGCQILVTVPHILQIMLLAPSNAKSWSSRVKYIIFDEIHSIGQAEDGVVWEQLLLLAPCPIIALSATVGNPEQFSSWLTATQETSGQRLTMIQHKVRYSDLRKFVYNAPKAFLFQGLADRPTFGTLGLDHIKGLSFIHPIASLVNKSRGIPDDLSLEARDCLYLYQAMNRHQSKTYPITASLGPPQSASTSVIRKADVLAWESNLKATLKVWMKDENSPFDQLREDLSKSMDENCTDEIEVSKGNLAELNSEDLTKIDPDNLYDTTLPLLCKLHERDALPAIFFNYDRTKCEGICQSIVANLEAAEARYKESSQAWKTKLSGFEQWKRNQSKAAAKKPVKAASKKKTNDPDDDGSSKLDRLQDAGDDINPYIGFDPLDPVDGYHFAVKHKAEASELSKYFYQITRRGLPSWLIDGLKRGVGVHHAGMNRKYRQVVEMLFRKGYLRVVIATGTLALGINMPCATVVFSGDSVFLTALNYRQAAGRAGRRGFDLLGNVVFQGISHGKICRLLSSRLPDLNGHFPVTTTLVLRLFSLLHDSGNSTYATKAIDSILSQPRLYLDGPSFKDQVLHHLRFSIEYLRRQDLLSSQGAPINFAGLTSHLYYTENSSFALNALIKEGYMHELCADIVTKESQVLRTLMLVLAHVFGRYPCRQASSLISVRKFKNIR